MQRFRPHPVLLRVTHRCLRQNLNALLAGALIFCFGCPPKRTAHKSPRALLLAVIKIELLEPESLHENNVETKSYSAWLRGLGDHFRRAFASYPKDRDVQVQITLYPKRPVRFEVAAKPPFSNQAKRKIEKRLTADQSIRSRFLPMSLQLTVRIGRGCGNPKLPFQPAIQTPKQRIRKRFLKQSLPEKIAFLKRWAQTGVLPMLATSAAGVAPRFKGVRLLGQQIKALDYSTAPDIAALTDKNHAYWRALLETTGGSQEVIPTLRTFLHVGNALLEQARRQVFVHLPFTPPQSVTRYLLDELNWYLDHFFQEVTAVIHLGTAQHDEGDYKAAIKTYKNVLRRFPTSALATYELYLSQSFAQLRRREDKTTLFSDWPQAAKKIYELDPLFSTRPVARSGPQAYRLALRLQLRKLFKKDEAFKKDLLRYADIALDLGAYGYAAHAYYLILVHYEPAEHNHRDMLAHFLFCMEKLEVTRIKTMFKGKLAQRIDKVAAQREKIMKDSVFYKSFKRKNVDPNNTGKHGAKPARKGKGPETEKPDSRTKSNELK
jgi:hypothetical protein